MEKQKFGKKFLESQIKTCEQTVSENVGIIKHCHWLLENMEMEEEIPK